MGIASGCDMLSRDGLNGAVSGLKLGAALFDEAACLEWLLKQCHSGEPSCPYCNHPLPTSRHSRFYAGGKFQCSGCQRWFTARTGTVLDKTRLDPRQVVAIVVLKTLGQGTGRIARFAGVDAATVNRWVKRLGSRFEGVEIG